MNLSVSLKFNAQRECYRVRFRGAGVDTWRDLPDEVFTKSGVNPRVASPRGEKIAWLWVGANRDQIERELVAPSMRVASKMTLAQGFAAWRSANPSMADEATLRVNHFLTKRLVEYFSDQLPETITTNALTLYRNWRLDATRERAERLPSPRTVQNEIMFARQLIKWMFENEGDTGCAAYRCLSRIFVPNVTRGKHSVSQADFFAMLKHRLSRKEDTAVIHRVMQAGVTTMLRHTTLLQLRWEWVDAERAWLHIPTEFMKMGRRYDKTLSVPLSQWSLQSFGAPRAQGFIFINPRTGRPFSTVGESLKGLAAKVGAADFGLHHLRATGNSWLADEGVPEVTRAVLMGHSLHSRQDAGAVNITGLYTFLSEDTLRGAVAAQDTIHSRWVQNGELLKFPAARR
jgi:integrase